MKLDRIPARMLLVLGLQPACGPSVGDDGSTAGDSGDGDSTQGSGSTGGITATSSGTAPGTGSGEVDVGPCLAEVGSCLDVGPCLGQEPETTGTGDDTGSTGATTIGPCLDVDPTTGGGSSGGSSDTGTIEPCLAPPPGDEPAPDHPAALGSPHPRSTQVLDRVLSSGRLPADVADRLKRRR
jgi:hypothetical protein